MKRYKVIIGDKINKTDSAIYVQQLIREAKKGGIYYKIYDEQFGIEIDEFVIKEDIKFERVSLKYKMNKYNRRRGK